MTKKEHTKETRQEENDNLENIEAKDEEINNEDFESKSSKESSENSGSEDEKVTEYQDENTGGGILFLVFLVIVILVLGGLFVYMQRVQETTINNDVETFESLYEKTLAGYETENNYLYNGYVFIKYEGIWQTRVDSTINTPRGPELLEDIPFSVHYDPRSVEDIYFNDSLFGLFERKDKIALSFNPDLGQYITLSGLEFAKVLVSFYNWPPEALEYGLLDATSSARYSEINCDNVTSNKMVIVFDFADETSISGEDGCIKVLGTNHEEVLRASNRFMYGLIGIIE